MKQRLQLALWYAAARLAGWFRPPTLRRAPPIPAAPSLPAGISVIIPSRSGQSLLAAQLPEILCQLAALPSQVLVVDNGSTDHTVDWLKAEWPQVEVEVSLEPLSFAAAINRGLACARYANVCLLNNDMLLDPGFFDALLAAFGSVPGLFCATAQIRFPPGVRREETGKTVMAQSHPDDFPVRCDDPIPGENLTYVLYGSGGCSLYEANLLRALGGVDEAYAPAYVEDLDLGYRAWQRGWPTVFVAGAQVEHRHRATTSRFYSEAQLAEILEVNYLKFLTRAVADGALFRELWREDVDRLYRRRDRALRFAAPLALAAGRGVQPQYEERKFLALTGGDVAVFPGSGTAEPLVMGVDRMERPPDETLAEHCEVVLVCGGRQLARAAAARWTELKWKAGAGTRAGGRRADVHPHI